MSNAITFKIAYFVFLQEMQFFMTTYRIFSLRERLKLMKHERNYSLKANRVFSISFMSHI